MTRAELLPKIFQLSEPDQIMIIEAIRGHLVDTTEPVDPAEFNAELDRRIADARAHPENDMPAEEVLRRIEARL